MQQNKIEAMQQNKVERFVMTIRSRAVYPALALSAVLLLASTRNFAASPGLDVQQSDDPRLLSAEDLTRGSRAAGIEVRVTFLTPLESAENGEAVISEPSGGEDGAIPEWLGFRVEIDTHMGNLMQYDLTRIVVLRNSRGARLETGFVWKPESESSHHRLGTLWLPNSLQDELLWEPGLESLELEIKRMAVPSRTFRWRG